MIAQETLTIHAAPSLATQLRSEIEQRTNGAIQGLEVSVLPDSIVLTGHTSRYYYKQLATSAVLEQFDAARLRIENAIHVNGLN